MKRALVVISSICAFGLTHSVAYAGAQVGEKAPDIDAGEWFNLPRGMESIRPKDIQGQIVMVEFWATW